MTGEYVEPRVVEERVICGVCNMAMREERGRTFEFEGTGTWMWYRCAFNPNHITRALPLPVRMARSC